MTSYGSQLSVFSKYNFTITHPYYGDDGDMQQNISRGGDEHSSVMMVTN